MGKSTLLARLCLKCILSIVVLFLLIAGISTWWNWFSYSKTDRDAMALPQTDSMGDHFDKVVYLKQGWTPADSMWFYTTTQGSDLLPYDFFLFLERPASTDLVRDAKNMNGFRYLPQNPTKGANPDGLPVGFVKDHYKGKDYLGFTCAACHTNQVNFQGTAIRVDGGPTGGDMDGFLNQMSAALKFTMENPDAKARFIRNVLSKRHYSDAKAVEDDLAVYAARLRRYQYINRSDVAYGYARLDAFGRIYNRVLEHILNVGQIRKSYGAFVSDDDLARILGSDEETFEQRLTRYAVNADRIGDVGVDGALTNDQRDELFNTVIRNNLTPDKLRAVNETFFGKPNRGDEAAPPLFNSPNAPVSYPFLWDIAQHDYVQWNGIAANAGLGPLGRNAGEVIGVFATLDWTKQSGFSLSALLSGQGFGKMHVDFESSVNAHNLRLVEERLTNLHSPKWPVEILGPIDAEKAKRGAVLYGKHCEECHSLIDRESPERRVVAHFDKIEAAGTDPRMADNSVDYTGWSGIIRNLYVSAGSTGSILLDERAPVAGLLTKSTEGVVATPYPYCGGLFKSVCRMFSSAEWLKDTALSYFKNEIKASLKSGDYIPDTTQSPFSSLKAYKGRPLDGIWATAPYLHNGSVPTLWDLLLPPKRRPATFLVGSREFDPAKVGFKSAGYEQSGFLYDTAKDGNRNTGHIYGVDMTDAERWDLLEYLKTL